MGLPSSSDLVVGKIGVFPVFRVLLALLLVLTGMVSAKLPRSLEPALRLDRAICEETS